MLRKSNHTVMIRISRNKILAYLFVFLVFINTGTACTLIYQVYGDRRYVWIRMSVILFSACFMLLLRKKRSIRRFVIFGLFIALFTGVNLINYPVGAFSLLHIMLKLFLFAGVLLFFEEKEIDIQNILYQMIIIICVFSLISYVLADVLKMPIPYQIYFPGENPNDFYRFYLGGFFVDRDYAFISVGPYTVLRLQAFFCEPGMYGIFLVMSLFYAWFIKKEKCRWKIGVLLINCVLTFSTTSLAITAVLIFFRLWYKSRNKENKVIFAFAVLPVAVVFIFILVNRKMSMVSGNLRYQDLVNGINLFVQKPVFGIGIRNVLSDQLLQNGRGNTNGLIFWLYTTGIFGMSALLFPFIRNIKKAEEKFTSVLYLAVFIICNMTEPITTLPYMTLLVAVEYGKMFKIKSCLRGGVYESGKGQCQEDNKNDLLFGTVCGEISAV